MRKAQRRSTDLRTKTDPGPCRGETSCTDDDGPDESVTSGSKSSSHSRTSSIGSKPAIVESTPGEVTGASVVREDKGWDWDCRSTPSDLSPSDHTAPHHNEPIERTLDPSPPHGPATTVERAKFAVDPDRDQDQARAQARCGRAHAGSPRPRPPWCVPLSSFRVFAPVKARLTSDF